MADFIGSERGDTVWDGGSPRRQCRKQKSRRPNQKSDVHHGASIGRGGGQMLSNPKKVPEKENRVEGSDFSAFFAFAEEFISPHLSVGSDSSRHFPTLSDISD